MPKLLLTKSLKRLALLILGSLASLTVRAETFILPPPDVDVIGEIRVIYAKQEDTLIDIARRYELGYDQILKANPGVDRWVPGEGTPIVLPSRYILPNAPRDGIVLNVPEMRLYYYPKPNTVERTVVITHPVSIGRMDWKTPLGRTSVVAKQKDPPWYPPASIKAEHAAEGDPLPDMIPGGTPDNPLGRYALRLGIRGYLIHGTDERKSNGIGMQVTHGCVRMYPEDIERLFAMVPLGTPVYIVNQPVKAGWLAGTLFMEFHAPLEEDNLPTKVTVDDATQAIAAKLGPDTPQIDQTTVELAVEQASGLPIAISN